MFMKKNEEMHFLLAIQKVIQSGNCLLRGPKLPSFILGITGKGGRNSSL